EALREHVPTELTVIGPSPEELAPLMLDPRGVRMLGKVGEEEKRAELEQADVLCAPSIGGESFGMILTEAFAAGTPVIASNIAGYADVVTDGVDGVLVPPADAQRLAEELQQMYVEPAWRERMAAAARANAERYAWPHVAERVAAVYERVQGAAAPVSAPEAVARRTG